MKTNNRAKISAHLCAALIALLAMNASGATIFNNSTTDLLTRLDAANREIGDQIILAGSERFLTRFAFEYYGLNSANPLAFAGANVEARVRFYENNGPAFNGYATPNNSFYDSGWFSVGAPTARNTFVFTAGPDFPSAGLFIPVNEMTWSVQFQGLGATDQLGVDIYGPATVGLTSPDYWANTGGTWSLLANGSPMNFAARFEAVPEPSSAALLVLGGLGLLAARSRVSKS
jgi:hypothetical protein